MPAASTPARAPRRVPLSRARVLAAGMAVADAGGIDGLTMRRLGEELGVEAMSLYRHVANKDDLLDGMIDEVFGEIVVPNDGAEWKPAMRDRALSALAALTRHPWATVLMSTRTSPGQATLRHHNAVLGCLRSEGFSIELVAHAISAIDAYLYGFAMQQRALPFEADRETAEVTEDFLAQFPAQDFPYLVELATEHIMKPGYDYGDEFLFGLELVLDGLERALGSR